MSLTAIVKSDDELEASLLTLDHQLVDQQQGRIVVASENLGLDVGHRAALRPLVVGVDGRNEDPDVGEARGLSRASIQRWHAG